MVASQGRHVAYRRLGPAGHSAPNSKPAGLSYFPSNRFEPSHKLPKKHHQRIR